MRTILNLIYFIFFGWWTAILWFIFGLVLCITIIGIPIGKQCLKFAECAAFPVGKCVVKTGGSGSTLLNILWFPIGLILALIYLSLGITNCCTIIGIPAGIGCFKLMQLCFAPFGKEFLTQEQIRAKSLN